VTRIAVIGGGAWGTALADLLARKGDAVTMWAREPEVVEAVNRQHANPVFLPGAALAPALRATATWEPLCGARRWSCQPRRRTPCGP